VEGPASAHARHIKAGNLSLDLLSSQVLEGIKDHTAGRGIFEKSTILLLCGVV